MMSNWDDEALLDAAGPSIHDLRLERGAASLREALSHPEADNRQALHALSRFGIWAGYLAEAMEAGSVEAGEVAAQLRTIARLGEEARDAWSEKGPAPDVFPHADVTERDIDFLVAEEVCCSLVFARWLLAGCGVEGDQATVDIRRSVTTPLGETDLMVTCFDGSRRHAVMIENKIVAEFQPNQAQRYRRRGQQGVESGEWDSFCTVLMAPGAYLAQVDEASFDFLISYEDLCERLARSGGGSARAQFRQQVVKQALGRTKTQYVKVVDHDLTAFFRSLRQLVEVEFPDVPFPPDNAGRAPNNGWVVAPLVALGAVRVVLEVKVFTAHVDLRFYGLHEAELRRTLAALLPEGAMIVGATRSSAVRLEVPGLSREWPVEEQYLAARAIFAAAHSLVIFFRYHQERIRPAP